MTSVSEDNFIRSDSFSTLGDYATVPISFQVRTIVKAVPSPEDPDSYHLINTPVSESYVKDYDLEESPTDWPHRFDLSNWCLLSVWQRSTNTRIGGAVIAFDTPGVDMLENRTDLAVLWDIRISPLFRGIGLGTLLFERVLHECRERGVSELKIETQDVNAGACRFYLSQGCALRKVNPGAYDGNCSNEIQFLFYRGVGQQSSLIE